MSKWCLWSMKKLDLTNKRFHKLKVIKLQKSSRSGEKFWECLCDCGNITHVRTNHLRRKINPVKSCGCLKFLKGKQHKDWKGVGDISGDWWSTRVMRSHKNRKNLPINITKDYAWKLFLKQEKKCYFTGIKINIAKNGTASLDRIDNTKGYIKGNVRWVHKDINFMRRTYSDKYFIDMCQKVVNNINEE